MTSPLSAERNIFHAYALGSFALSLISLCANYAVVEHIEDHPEPLDLFGTEVEKEWLSAFSMGVAVLGVFLCARFLSAAQRRAHAGVA